MNKLALIEDPQTYWLCIRIALGAAVFGRAISLVGYSKTGQFSANIGIYGMVVSVLAFLAANARLSLK